MKLTRTDRWILSNQYRILEALYPNEATAFAEAREAIECGYELHYRSLSEHIYDEGFSVEECNEVVDILDMFCTLKHSYEELPNKSGIDASEIEFDGFDGNYETKHMVYARYFCNHDGGRFSELTPNNDFNSHAPRLDRYRRMVKRWKDCADKHSLKKEDILRIMAA